MAPTPGKKVNQGITTFLTTADNLQGQTKNEPGLNTAYSDITKGVTGATNKAAGTAQQATKDTANKTSADALAPTTKVNQSAYTQPPAPTTKVAPTTSGPANLNSFLNYDPSKSAANISGQVATGTQGVNAWADTATTGLDAEAAKQLAAGNKVLGGIGKSLTEGQGKITDDNGNVIGSNRGIGQVGQLNPLEQAAVTRQQFLGQQGPTSNTDALRTLFGMNYNEALGPLGSQVYQGQVAQARGQAAADTVQRQQAEAGRIGANEQYTGALAKGTENVAKAGADLSKNIDAWLKDEKTKVGETAKNAKDDITKDAAAATEKDKKTQIKDGTRLAMESAAQFVKAAGTPGTTVSPGKVNQMIKKLKELGADPMQITTLEALVAQGMASLRSNAGMVNQGVSAPTAKKAAATSNDLVTKYLKGMGNTGSVRNPQAAT